jgi:hypothetical protein
MANTFCPLDRDGRQKAPVPCEVIGRFCVARRSNKSWGIYSLTGHVIGGSFYFKSMAVDCLTAIIDSPILAEAVRRLDSNQPLNGIDPTPLMEEIFSWEICDEMMRIED